VTRKAWKFEDARRGESQPEEKKKGVQAIFRISCRTKDLIYS